MSRSPRSRPLGWFVNSCSPFLAFGLLLATPACPPADDCEETAEALGFDPEEVEELCAEDDGSPPGDGEADCDDGVDNDGDGHEDCADQDCDGDDACDGDGGPTPEADLCDDGEDNDGDGYVDCADQDCEDAAACGDDSDGDGSPDNVDCNDSDPTIHPGAAEDCDDGVDNDCDGYVDDADQACDDGGDQTLIVEVDVPSAYNGLVLRLDLETAEEVAYLCGAWTQDAYYATVSGGRVTFVVGGIPSNHQYLRADVDLPAVGSTAPWNTPHNLCEGYATTARMWTPGRVIDEDGDVFAFDDFSKAWGTPTIYGCSGLSGPF